MKQTELHPGFVAQKIQCVLLSTLVTDLLPPNMVFAVSLLLGQFQYGIKKSKSRVSFI